MPDEKPYPKLLGALQAVQLIVTIALAVLAFQLDHRSKTTDSLVKQLDQDLKERQGSFKQAIGRIETELKLKQDERAALEAAEKLRFQLFVRFRRATARVNEQCQQQRPQHISVGTQICRPCSTCWQQGR